LIDEKIDSTFTINQTKSKNPFTLKELFRIHHSTLECFFNWFL